jgi:DNA-binding transcriptional MerR regulator
VSLSYYVPMSESEGYSIEALEARTGVSARTIRFYISQDLLPGPRTRGRGAAYDEEHLARLKLIQRLRGERMPLFDIRDRLTGLSAADIGGLLDEEERRHEVLEQAASSTSPKDYISTLLARAREDRGEAITPGSSSSAPAGSSQGQKWERWELMPGVELHVRSDVKVQQARLIRRLLEFIRGL